MYFFVFTELYPKLLTIRCRIFLRRGWKRWLLSALPTNSWALYTESCYERYPRSHGIQFQTLLSCFYHSKFIFNPCVSFDRSFIISTIQCFPTKVLRISPFFSFVSILICMVCSLFGWFFFLLKLNGTRILTGFLCFVAQSLELFALLRFEFFDHTFYLQIVISYYFFFFRAIELLWNSIVISCYQAE